MSLKITHVVLIILSMILSGFFSYTMYSEQNTSILAGLGMIATVSLLYYLSIILKKFKTI